MLETLTTALRRVTVSYTHLDVYKRQVYHHAGVGQCGAFAFGTGNQQYGCHACRHSSTEDVYKRHLIQWSFSFLLKSL